MGHAYNPSTLEVGAGRSPVHGHLQLHTFRSISARRGSVSKTTMANRKKKNWDQFILLHSIKENSQQKIELKR